jgi:hypothetical protein
MKMSFLQASVPSSRDWPFGQGEELPVRLIVVDPELVTDLFIEPDEVLTLEYRLWHKRNGRDWFQLGAEEMREPEVHHWMFLPPLTPNSEFAYSLTAENCAGQIWRVRIGVRQRVYCDPDGWTIRAMWTEMGKVDQGAPGARHGEAANRVVLCA